MPAFAPPNRESAHDAFEVFAPHYDAFTADHDYERWTADLIGLARSHGLRGTRLLDIACGTGKSSIALARAGFAVVACDHNAAMLAVAQRKAGSDIAFRLCDARELPRLGRFDLITILGDVVNYLLDPDELSAMFRGVAGNLADDGLVVFDANTLWTYATTWASDPALATDGSHVSWRCLAGPGLAPGDLAAAELLVTASGAEPQRSVHYQRHHPQSVIRRALSDAGLDAVSVRGQFPAGRLDGELDEHRHNKAIYVASRRPHSRKEVIR